MRVGLLRLRRGPLFYGWYIFGVALIAQFVSVGTQAYATGVFLEPMTHDLGWSRQSYSAVQTLSVAVSGAVGFFIGGIMDRRGPRVLMLIGGFIGGFALIGTSFVDNLWQFYLVRGVVQTVAVALFSNLVVNVTLAKWFVVRRGMAIALASIGIPLSGIVMAPVVAWWVTAYGWRPAWVMLGIMVWVLVLPAALLMRRMPEDSGLMPDGMSEEAAAAYTAATKRLSSASEVHWTRAEAVRTKALWMIILGYGTGTIALGALLLHTVPLLTDAGFSRQTAAFLLTTFSWGALSSKFVWAPLMDRFHPRYLSAIGFAVGAVTVAALPQVAGLGSAWTVMIPLFVYGFAIGGLVPLQETVWASYFGRAHLGEIRSVGMPFSIIFSAGGPFLGGALYDRTGDYVAAFAIFAVFSVLGCVLVLLASPPRPSERAVLATGLPAARS